MNIILNLAIKLCLNDVMIMYNSYSQVAVTPFLGKPTWNTLLEGGAAQGAALAPLAWLVDSLEEDSFNT